MTRDRALRERVTDIKLYTTICSSAPSELLVAIAVRQRDLLIDRNRRLTVDNLPLVDRLLQKRPELFEWVRPTGASIGFALVRPDPDVREWCEQLAERAGVLQLPGDVYDRPRHVRLGFGRADLAAAIERFERYLDGCR